MSRPTQRLGSTLLHSTANLLKRNFPMNKAMLCLAFCALVALVDSSAVGQNRNTKNSASKQATSTPRTLCKGQPVPKGFVIIGYKSSVKCAGEPELAIKKPVNPETVCDGSPIPEGYHIISQQGLPACYTTESNPLTNALSIARDDIGASSPTAVNPERERESVRQPRVIIQVVRGAVSEDDPKPKSVVDQRAAEEQKKTEIELAVLHNEIKVGMTTDQVLAAWGRPYDVRNLTSPGSGTSTTWIYRKGNESVHLDFKDGILKDWTWFH
jgi:hypothetical protein